MYNPQLETFLRVADAGSFNKAAEESYITPTAVIKQINLLEESLGVKLFDRSHRGLQLTKAGRSMYQDARYIIQYCRDSVTRAKNAMQEDENIIRIGSSPMTPAQLIFIAHRTTLIDKQDIAFCISVIIRQKFSNSFKVTITCIHLSAHVVYSRICICQIQLFAIIIEIRNMINKS